MTEHKKNLIDLNVEDIKQPRGPSAHTLVWALSSILVVVSILLTLYIVGNTLDFEPLTIYDYTVEPSEVCAFDRFDVYQDIEIEDKWYYSLDDLEGESYMIDSEGKPYGGTYFKVGIYAVPRDIYPSNTVRLAPPEPGEWWAGGSGKLTGRMFYMFPVTQDLGEIKSSNSITTKDWDAQECLEEKLPSLVDKQ